ncbi:ankyrin repeat domain-containing protein [Larkinella rosea]|uniref:Uncharacterized protein n=1 Tax=Larkinella rosea TaxID=2025312 RepID=A0A3P1BU28_9BACT|nr:hypothetical protein [Larkinella rosea]RRB04429.1 hypothetical protein EHT25_13090 [Larkinella rosea]
MKAVTISNWVLISIYVLLVIYTLMTVNRSGNDAAGRGMELGFAVLGAFLLASLIVLNIIPYKASKITALVILSLPFAISLIGGIRHFLALQKQRRDAVAAENGSFYFEDKERQRMAAAIAAGDVAQLKALLQKPQPLLNESGYQSTTLLSFAATRTFDNDNPEPILACMELLVQHGATVQGPDSAYAPVHFMTCPAGSAALLAWFLQKGADPNVRPADASPILFEVMKYGDEQREKVQLLLDHGADPNALAASNGYHVGALYSPLLFAAHQELWDVCQLLLERGADPSYQVPEEVELIRIMKQTSYYAGNTESQGENLAIIMAKHEKKYAESGQMPEAYTVFKRFLNTKSTPKS